MGVILMTIRSKLDNAIGNKKERVYFTFLYVLVIVNLVIPINSLIWHVLGYSEDTLLSPLLSIVFLLLAGVFFSMLYQANFFNKQQKGVKSELLGEVYSVTKTLNFPFIEYEVKYQILDGGFQTLKYQSFLDHRDLFKEKDEIFVSVATHTISNQPFTHENTLNYLNVFKVMPLASTAKVLNKSIK